MNDVDLEGCVRLLEDSGRFRVLRRLEFETVRLRLNLSDDERLALVLDTETTGLDKQNDQVIELGMVAFTYDRSGSFRRIVGTFNGFQEPSVPITREISAITGITAEMVAGKQLPMDQVATFVDSAALIIAHNAAFDRPFCERLSPSFRDKAWACSATEVPWRELGFEGTKLAYLLNQSGYFHDGHRALDDSFALMRVLFTARPGVKEKPFQALLLSARETRYRIRCKVKYDFRSELRSRGYRWAPHPTGKGHWHNEVSDAAVQQEILALQERFRVSKDEIWVDQMTAFNRFRDDTSL